MAEYFHGGDTGKQRFAQDLGNAMEDIGFAILTNHGVDTALFEKAEEQIAAMTVKTRELLANKGISRSLGQVLDDIDHILPTDGLSISFSECAAMHITLTHRQARDSPKMPRTHRVAQLSVKV